MKSSSPSPSSPSFDANIFSQKSRCIISMLRRILCSGSLPTHPTSDHSVVMEEEAEEEKRVADSEVVPGLVARLMGLDTIPDRITRSRSLSSVDQIKVEQAAAAAAGADQEGKQEGKLHRRSKSSFSFREYIDMDDDDDEFIVLRFDNGPRRKAHKKRAKSEDQKQKKTVKKKKQIRLLKKKEQGSSDSEESSPVSIFDFHQSPQTDDTPTSDDDSWTNSSRISSPEQDKAKISTEQDEAAAAAAENRLKPEAALLNKTVVVVTNSQKKKNKEMWGRVCSNITVADINGAADSWNGGKEDLAEELEVHIMDQLFNELLLQLCFTQI